MKNLCTHCGSVTTRIKRNLIERLRHQGMQKRICLGCGQIQYTTLDKLDSKKSK